MKIEDFKVGDWFYDTDNHDVIYIKIIPFQGNDILAIPSGSGKQVLIPSHFFANSLYLNVNINYQFYNKTLNCKESNNIIQYFEGNYQIVKYNTYDIICFKNDYISICIYDNRPNMVVSFQGQHIIDDIYAQIADDIISFPEIDVL